MEELDLITTDNIKDLNSDMESYFSEDAYKMFWNSIKYYSILQPEENKKLAILAQNGDEKARDKLIKHNLRLVAWVAKKYKNRIQHMQILDIIQEGTIGLMKSIETFDQEKGSFANNAIYWIKSSISKAIFYSEDDIRKPIYFEIKNKAYLNLIEEYKKDNKDLPSDDKLCEILDVSLETLFYLKNYNYNPISINQKVKETDDSSELENFIIVDDKGYEEVIEKLSNNDLFAVLKEILLNKEYFVVYHRYLSDDGKTLDEIGKLFGITREAVRQMEAKALNKIKPYIIHNSHCYQNTVKRLNEIGKSLNHYNLKPICINNAILFLYIKDELSYFEKELMYCEIFGKMKLSWYIKNFNIGEKEFLNAKKSIYDKLQKVLLNKKEFNDFKKDLIKNKGTKILEFSLEEYELFDFNYLKIKYAYLSYEEVIDLMKKYKIKATDEEMGVLRKYYINLNNRRIMIKEEMTTIYKILMKIEITKVRREQNAMTLRRKK